MRSSRLETTSRPRFYAPDLDPSVPEATLTPEESHHLVRVMRLGVGDDVSVFDGRGHEFQARIVRPDKRGTVVSLGTAVPMPPAPRVATVLVQAVLKGDKMDDVVRDATMVGAAQITPIVTDRAQVKLSALERGHAHERWQRVAIASAKQCRRAALPAIDPPSSFADWLAGPARGPRLLLVEPSVAAAGVVPLRDALRGSPTTVECVVGPEGGWAPEEQSAAASAGCVLVSLGATTLRADAVGLVAVSLIQFVADSGA